jgi:hypothetical protein
MQNPNIPVNSQFIVLGQDTEIVKEESWLNQKRVITDCDNCYVAFLDILGFKELFDPSKQQSKPLKKILELFTGYVGKSIYKRRNHADELSRHGHSSPTKPTQILMISDSIVVKTRDASYDSLAAIIDTAIDLVWAGFIAGVPLRGCITKNCLLDCNLHDDNLDLKINIYWSQGIIDTFTFEKRIQIAGCMLLDDVKCQIPGFLKSNSEYTSKLINYSIPMKEDVVCEGFMLNWTQGPFFATTMGNPDGTKDSIEEFVKQAFLRGKDKLDKPSDQEKLENTLAFYSALNKT